MEREGSGERGKAGEIGVAELEWEGERRGREVRNGVERI